jgi:hypothetical protein
MDYENKENMKELFGKFFGAEQAEKYIEDFEKAEQILRQYPAPGPDDMLVANIKAEIAMRLPARKATLHRRIFFETAAIAASFIILAFVGLSLFKTTSNEIRPPIISAAIWDSKDITTDDMELAGYNVELEQLENELQNLQSSDEGLEVASAGALTELETNLMEIDSGFWKE